MLTDPYVYQYTVGGIVFLIGVAYAFKQGYVGFSPGRPLRNLILLFGGLAVMMILQGYLQYGEMSTAEPVAFDGDPEAVDGHRLGTGLDYGIMAAYFIAILVIGTFFGRGQKDTKDFFFGGQRFSWWLIAFSLIASLIGSYSFVKYSRVSYGYGLASSQTYLNDWFWIPLLLFGWLPILYFSRITSIPEYFERRFGPTSRKVVTVLLLTYLIGYVGVNLFTMGTTLEILLGWPVFVSALGVALISLTYVTFGGQTSVIMTDLFQGVMLLAAGLLILFLGIEYLDGFSNFWEHLPREHRRAFAQFNEPSSYHSVGIFWQDAMANSAMFYFLNQGILMRFMAARSVNEGRKAALVVPIILMPIAAAVVASGGWVGKALEHAGYLPPDMNPDQVFFIATDFLSQPGVFGLVLAALTAALMSTVDTLVTAVSAIVVNDIYKPLRPQSTDQQQLKAARIAAVGVMVIGLALVPVFAEFKSIYSAHGAFTAAVTPPLVIALLLSVFWRRFSSRAAIATMVGGSAMIILSVIYPDIIAPFAHGVEPGEGVEGFKKYKFMRAFFGLGASLLIGVIVGLATRPEKTTRTEGLVWGTVKAAIQHYKGSPGEENESDFVLTRLSPIDTEPMQDNGRFPLVRISHALANALQAQKGDLLYITDARSWLGGLRSTHAVIEHIGLGVSSQDAGVDAVTPDMPHDDEPVIELGPRAYEAIVARGRGGKSFKVQKLYAAVP